MRPIPQKLKDAIRDDPYFRTCARREYFDDHECGGAITIEHAFIYAGKQINELWAFVPICAKSHSVGIYQNVGIIDKRKNEFLALLRATDEDLRKYPNRDWKRLRTNLCKQYERK